MKNSEILCFIRANPACTQGEIARGIDCKNYSGLKNCLAELLEDGHIVRAPLNNNQYVYSVEGGADSVVDLGNIARIVDLEFTASGLEEAGMWRRAAQVYLDLMGIATGRADLQRYAERRRRCIRNGNVGCRTEAHSSGMVGRYVGGDL
jgi:hypothetical protein